MNQDNRPASYPLRLEPETRSKLEAIAKANGRSLNAEIVIRLEETLLKDDEISQSGQVLSAEQVRQIALEVIREELAKAGKG
ncbi:MAG: hypothetical protein RLZZ215_2975 [Pseudomonadota bacterium]|jgi:hypothetical protein